MHSQKGLCADWQSVLGDILGDDFGSRRLMRDVQALVTRPPAQQLPHLASEKSRPRQAKVGTLCAGLLLFGVTEHTPLDHCT
jgi:hypothetical protein